LINLRKLRNEKGLSPIFAVLILIAITVIAAIVVYMYSSGYLASMMGWGTAGQEKVAIQAVDVNNGKLIISNSGTTSVKITAIIIRDSQGNAVSSEALSPAEEITAGAVKDIDVDLPTVSGSYTAAVVTDQGNQFVSGSFKIG